MFVTAVLALSLAWPPAAELFRFGPLHADDLAITVAAAVVSLVLLETVEIPVAPSLACPSLVARMGVCLENGR